MAGEFADTRRERDQDGAVRADLASIHRTTHWHDSTGMPGPHPVLDRRRSGDEAPRVPALLQRRFILPHLAMCLKTQDLLAQNLVSRLGDFGPGRERPAWRPLELPARGAETPTDHRAADAPLQFRLARRRAGVFSD